MTPEHAAPLDLIRESERLFLRDPLTTPDGVAGRTNAPPPFDRKPFPDGGRWRGDIPKSLVRRGVITPLLTSANETVSTPVKRPPRQRTRLLKYKLIDRRGAQQREAELTVRNRRTDRGLFDDLN